ncbi:MAG: aromatic amino acid ammonia-lyase [Myxococcales bacterium]|nr:aromatic amino acid ammonia-lyase [Myxococcales bacterium]
MTIALGTSPLTIDDVVSVARGRSEVELSEQARHRLGSSWSSFQARLAGGESVYGFNTGIGDFSERALSADDMRGYQRGMVRSHAAGFGDEAPEELVRAAMLVRAQVLQQGRSGCRPQVVETLLAMLNRGVTPVVCLRGSVGACGDLAPLAQVALLLCGEGEAVYQGARMPGHAAMALAGIEIPGFEGRDGLACINGANFLTASSALQLYDVQRFLRHAEIVAAMGMEALRANADPLHPLLHKARGFQGAELSARAMVRCIEGGDLFGRRHKTRLQDAYSLRATPQIVGAARDAVVHAQHQVEIELNGVGDNPLFFSEAGMVLTGANFQGTPVSLPMEMVGSAVTAVCVMSERRLNRLLNPALSGGLPAFLAANPGPQSGLMISQYTAGALVAEQRILCTPATIGSIPAAADQEDFVSMGMTTAIKNQQILAAAQGVLGIEAIGAAQALDLRESVYGDGVAAARDALREVVAAIEDDRALYGDHAAVAEFLSAGALLDAVEAAVGTLP